VSPYIYSLNCDGNSAINLIPSSNLYYSKSAIYYVTMLLSAGANFAARLGAQPVKEEGDARVHGGLSRDAAGSDVGGSTDQFPGTSSISAADEGSTGVSVAGASGTSGIKHADVEVGVVGGGVAATARLVVNNGDLGLLQGYGDGAVAARAAPAGDKAGVRQAVDSTVQTASHGGDVHSVEGHYGTNDGNIVGRETLRGVAIGVVGVTHDRGSIDPGTRTSGDGSDLDGVRANSSSDAVTSGDDPVGVSDGAAAVEGSVAQETSLPRPFTSARGGASNDLLGGTTSGGTGNQSE